MTAPPMLGAGPTRPALNQPVAPPVPRGPVAPPIPGPEHGAAPVTALEQLHAELDALLPAHSTDTGSPQDPRTELAPLDAIASRTLVEADPPEPTMEQDVGLGDTQQEDVRSALAAAYGYAFPPVRQREQDTDAWGRWPRAQWDAFGKSGALQERLALNERNRRYRNDDQWISRVGSGTWRTPPKPKDAMRAVDNVIGPALDQRVEIVSEQRPGFRVRPETQDQRNQRKAEAQQIALEYQYDQQRMPAVIRTACYWSGTDGVAFLGPYWDPDRGPWDEVWIPSGQHDENGVQQLAPRKMPLGDLCTMVFRMDQVRVSPEATAIRKPSVWVVRETLPTSIAVQDYGPQILEGLRRQEDQAGFSTAGYGAQGSDPERFVADHPTVDRFTVYCDKSEFLAGGLMLVTVGDVVVVPPQPLPWGRVPLVRWTDGSTDPTFYPRPIMDGWIAAQQRINALKSKLYDAIRLGAGFRLIAKENAVKGETLIGNIGSVVSVSGPGTIAESVQPINGFSIGNDVKEAIAEEKACFERISGWSDVSRGQFQGDPSGRSVLAQRELLERIFGAPVNAAAEAMGEWGEVCIAAMRWGYDTPRMLSVEGSDRPDLAKEFASDDFDGVANVWVDPETLMPLPRSMRLMLLDTAFQNGEITLEEKRRRTPYAWVRNLDTPDTVHYARAKRAVEAVKQTGQPNPPQCPVLWQDNEAIHQDVLERDLILDDTVPPPLRSAAIQRWTMLAQQAAAKQGPPPGMAPGGPQGGGSAGGANAPALPPTETPFQGTNPGVAAGTMTSIGSAGAPGGAQLAGVSDSQRRAATFDASQAIR